MAELVIRVSKDAMPNNRNKERRQRALVSDALSQGRSVVVDNTNPTREDRRPLVGLGRAHGARIVGCYLPVPVEDALGRNTVRQGRARVPVVGILATAKKLEVPTVDEGFDELHLVPLESPDRHDVAIEDLPEHQGQQHRDGDREDERPPGEAEASAPSRPLGPHEHGRGRTHGDQISRLRTDGLPG